MSPLWQYPVFGMLNFGGQEDSNLAFRTWHYPVINENERYYQQRIIESSLMKNTLVCLPTGLGKTFIGLVVMYNFHRWFPSRKILFMAPTRPLVNQQYRAWTQQFAKQLNISAIEITGGMGPEKRHQAWATHNFFFTTPQVLENDLADNIIEKDSIVCLIIDEAHKAVGNYAYCAIVKMLSESNVRVRICALTATPGSTLSSIQSVIKNLKIEQVEYLNEQSEEIKPFVSHRSREVLTIPSDPIIESVKSVIDDIVRKFYLFPLRNFGQYLNSDIDSISVASLSANQQHGAVEGYLAGLRIMLHIRDLLIFYGINSMLSYIKSLENGQMKPLKSRIRKQLHDSEDFQRMLLGLHSKMANGDFQSHPKLELLWRILTEHFSNSDSNSDTRAMVFSNYRESVSEICQYLQKISPRLKPIPLLGHSSQNDSHRQNKLNQQNAIDGFIRGNFNILVTTCIGEEGLDIGFVDLIVFYDAHSSPIRLVQRSGRTGRQRDGKIIILVNEKKEKKLLESSEKSSKFIENVMANSNSHFQFENSITNPLSMSSGIAIQMVKFKLSKSINVERPNMKRSLSYIPHNMPSVKELVPKNSIINELIPHGPISHSLSSESLVNILSQNSTPSTERKKCLSVWKQGLKSMTIFKLFNYQKNDMKDYNFFMDIISKERSQNEALEELPDSFFDPEGFDLEDDMNITDNSFHPERSSDKLLELDMDESKLEELDWSDHDF